MIRFVTPGLVPLFKATVQTFGIFGVKLYSMYQTYGAQSGAAEFWLIGDGGQPCGAVARQDGRFTVAATALTDAQARELDVFFGAAGGRSVEGELGAVERLGAFAGETYTASWILRREEGFPAVPLPQGVKLVRAASLRAVYELLCESDGGFRAGAAYDVWLCEMSHKTRHGLADIFTLLVDDIEVSTLSILFKCETSAILSAVATRPAFRRRGFAGALLDFAAGTVRAQGLTLFLLAGADDLLPFYTQKGFVPAGRWAAAEKLG